MGSWVNTNLFGCWFRLLDSQKVSQWCLICTLPSQNISSSFWSLKSNWVQRSPVFHFNLGFAKVWRETMIGNHSYATIAFGCIQVGLQEQLRKTREEVYTVWIVLICHSPYDGQFICPVLLVCLVANLGRSSMSSECHRYTFSLSPSLFAGIHMYLIDIDDKYALFDADPCRGSRATDKVLWNILGWFGRVITIIMSVPTDYVSEAIFVLMWRTIWSKIYM